ncbi:hypothetical protein GOP47_0016805 [Adiantum capillus-veneris]|uniref:Uncharacterized protein n=1 Tax=Adiantum capillus-veneris TaxID=13818 RepID=A0A9D4UIH7_ADICA|nr:hypothetical protein GOP47_0016805 [Adiantum capillus-veneris]
MAQVRCDEGGTEPDIADCQALIPLFFQQGVPVTVPIGTAVEANHVSCRAQIRNNGDAAVTYDGLDVALNLIDILFECVQDENSPGNKLDAAHNVLFVLTSAL